ncbi:MAG: SPFH domain-containing protein [Candidatus Dormibacteraeota bacterium]|nr:SPFH domain-containing protein [Candidatus Dormibacteraeota bacterium]
MGLFGGEVRREFIARPDSAKAQILYKWPDENIRKWTQLTVQQDELAVFFRDGQVQGTVQPGRSTLDSSEIPFLGKLVDAASGGNMFKTEIYFISTREFPNLPFGGSIDNVVDPDTGIAVGLRVFGEYSLKAVEPQSLILQLVGTQQLHSNDQITDWMREMLLKVLRTDVTSHIVSQGWAILGIAAHTEEVEQETIAKVQDYIQSYGLQIVRLGNFTISIKEEDETTLKNFRKDVSYTKLAGGFQQYASGEAMLGVGQGAAQGGGALPPALLGIGLGMGQNITGQQGQAVASGGAIQVRCGNCSALNPESAKFCSSCGQSIGAAAPAPTGSTVKCSNCSTENAATAKFCAGCGNNLQQAAPAPAAAEPPAQPGPEGPA